jgi:hypothetical protein
LDSHELIAHLIAELHTLSSWGATPKRLAYLARNLRQVLQIPPPRIMPNTKAGNLMRRRLQHRLSKISGEIPLLGRTYAATQIKMALQYELGLDASTLSAPDRRALAMDVLGLPYSEERWRRADGPHMQLLSILAEALVPEDDNEDDPPMAMAA